MEEALVKKSGILFLKSKFFLYRVFIYFSFLLFPIWIQKTTSLNNGYLLLLMMLYIGFMASQWFMLGKEIDHRLKIYFRVNSSIDRVIYRLILGMSFAIFYFNLLSLFPNKWAYNFFWLTWASLGLFYSWPSRGKIIQESVSSNFTEYKYLDSFEKTVLILVCLIFFISFPDIPRLDNFEALKLYFDPNEHISNFLWQFLGINYLPFKKYSNLFRIALGMHFYFVGIGLFLVTFYGVLRYFVGRRLSILGVFAFLSSWSFSKILSTNYSACILASTSIIFIWSMLWTIKSASYRSGLFFGMVGFLLTVFDIRNSLVYLIGLALLLLFFLKEKTPWFKKQFLKYNLIGIIFIIIVFIFKDFDSHSSIREFHFIKELSIILNQKAFFALSIIGLPLCLLKYFSKTKDLGKFFQFSTEQFSQFAAGSLIILVGSLLTNNALAGTLNIMGAITLLSVIPLEFIFQAMSRLRSHRNIIYLLYILICLLDSHFEGRVKIFMKFIDS